MADGRAQAKKDQPDRARTDSVDGLEHVGQSLRHQVHRQVSQPPRVPKQNHAFTPRRPDRLVALAPENERRQAQCGGQMRNAGVMPGERATTLEPVRELCERKVSRDLKPIRWQARRKTLKPVAFRFAADQQKF